MRVVDDRPETIHLYVVRDEAPKPQLFPIFLSAFALLVLVALCTAIPYEQPVTRAVIRVPAVLLPPKTFTAKVSIIPTGVRTYPATTAHGILTITNGSIIGQRIPAGFTIQGVVTDSAVFVPAGSANGYGYAVVPAHALIRGKRGNIPAYAINQVEGSSVYIRNLSAFSGGEDGYSVKIVTAKDRGIATSEVRNTLLTMSLGLHYPCSEVVSVSNRAASVSWRCQFVTYHIPGFYHVTGVRIIGKNLLLTVWFVARPTHLWVK